MPDPDDDFLDVLDGPAMSGRSITEVMRDLDADLEVDSYDLSLSADRDPTINYITADQAVANWLESLDAPSRLAEADYLQDCLAKVLAHFSQED